MSRRVRVSAVWASVACLCPLGMGCETAPNGSWNAGYRPGIGTFAGLPGFGWTAAGANGATGGCTLPAGSHFAASDVWNVTTGGQVAYKIHLSGGNVTSVTDANGVNYAARNSDICDNGSSVSISFVADIKFAITDTSPTPCRFSFMLVKRPDGTFGGSATVTQLAPPPGQASIVQAQSTVTEMQVELHSAPSGSSGGGGGYGYGYTIIYYWP